MWPDHNRAMHMFHYDIDFFLTSLVIILLPGTGVIYTVAATLSDGIRSGFLAALGCTLGIIPSALASVSGVAALLQANMLAFQVLKYLGVAYLLYLAWAIFTDNGSLGLDQMKNDKNTRQVALSAVLINLLNPKLVIFFFAFLPQFIKTGTVHPVTRMLMLSLVFMGMTFVVFAAYASFASMFRRHVIGNIKLQTRLQHGFAIAFAALALQLAVS